VQPLDFNEDMDAMEVWGLGIGTDLPFAVELGMKLEPVKEPRISSEQAEAASSSVQAGEEQPVNSTPLSDTVKPVKAGTLSWGDRQALKDLSAVWAGLFLSGQMGATNRRALQDIGVTHIINCCDRVPCKFPKMCTYKVICVSDIKSSNIQQHFEDALPFIDDALSSGGRCLVHCMVGASRSTSIVLAWLVSRQRLPLKAAYQHVSARRPVARPNRGFCQQLIDFEMSELGSRSASLKDFGHKTE